MMNDNLLQSKLVIAVLLLVLFSGIYAQDFYPDAGQLYDMYSVSRVDITIDPDDLNLILAPENRDSDIEYMATFTFTHGNYIQTIDSVGFRLRGNTSRNSPKKSFKVSFNTFIPGRKFFGVEKLNINGEHNDPSISRAIISWYICRQAGIISSRAAHTELYINGEYRGLYANVEHVDEEFIRTRYRSNDGNLYKCLWPADLTYLGSNADDYKATTDQGRRYYELKINEEEDDYSDLANFISVLNNTDPNDFQTKLEPYFNVNAYLKNQAVEVLIGHWDGYAYNKNNFYLYHNEGSDKLEFIPYDLDNTLGIDWIGRDWAERNMYSWAQSGGNERPLYRRLLENEVYYDRYSFYLNEILEHTFNNAHLDPILERLIDSAKSSAANDTYMEMNYGFDYDVFINSLVQAAGGHVQYGIAQYITKRYNEAVKQLDLNSIDPIITLMYVNQPDMGNDARIQFLIEDDNEITDHKVWFSSGGNFKEVNTEQLEGGLYQAISTGLHSAGTLRFYIEAKDSQANMSRDPYEGYYYINYGAVTIEGEKLLSEFGVYPNPANHYFSIVGDELYSGNIYTILDAAGRVCQIGRVDNSAVIQIDASLVSGLYFVKLKAENSDKQYKISKLLINRSR